MNLEKVEGIYPLSPAQEDSAEAGAQGVCQLVCELEGELDEASFERAWLAAARRHPALRSSFASKRVGRPLQVVWREAGAAFARHDWRDADAARQEEQWDELLRAERDLCGDAAAPPTTRAALCILCDGLRRFVYTYHPLALDRRSLRLVWSQAWADYTSLRLGRVPEARPALSQREYAAWLKGQPEEAGAEGFWRGLTPEGGTPLQAPDVSDEGAAARAENYCERRLTLRPETGASLLSALGRRGLTLDALAEGVWALLLSVYAGAEEVAYAVEVGGRPASLPGAEHLVGNFARRLPARTAVPHDALLWEWLRELAARQADMLQHAHATRAQLAAWGATPPAAGPCGSIVALDDAEDFAVPECEDGRVRVSDVRLSEPDSAALVCGLREARGRVSLRLTYDMTRFGEEFSGRALAHLENLLEAVATAGDTARLSNLSVLSERELEQLLVGWNETASDYPREATLHELFEEQAARTPEAVAVVCGDETLTYAELNRRANQLAHYLKSLGVGPEVAVGVCLERSAGLIVALLGVLKAGGLYVPLDVSYPLERLSFMLGDAGVAVLVATDELVERLPSHWAQIVSVDGDAELIAAEGEGNPVARAAAENLAYVMYTSGSTGVPKGVAVTHRNVVRLVRGNWFAPLTASDTVLHFAPASFDASTFEIWGPLLSGARLAVMKPGQGSLEELETAIERHEVTALWLTAGLFHLVVDERPQALRRLKRLLAGGDALSPAHVRRVLEAHPGLVLVNGYGPTENTTFSCCHVLESGADVGKSMPIGKPIANSTAYVLDARLRPVPVGVAGELYVGGDGMARGYLNRPGLTAERFVPHPFSEEPGARLYRTGDVVRRLPDGDLEFLGRTDMQVKVRGFRVELGEIESALAALSSVSRCAVVAREDAAGEKHLVAYAVPREGGEFDGAAMRAALRERLPEYMIPSQLVVLDELPLTPNGKVDRRRLPAPDEAARRDGWKVSTPPSTPEELVLAEIWQEVLGVERVCVEDNFFDLGGDSLRSLQTRARAQRRGYDFSIQQLFEHQTISALARHLLPVDPERRDTADEPFNLIAEEDRLRMPDEVEDAYPLAMLQSGMLFHNALDPEAALYHEVFTFHLRAAFDAEALRAAVGRLVARHAVLRTSFDLTSYGEPLQLVRRVCEVPIQSEDWRALPAAEQEERLARWVEEDKRSPFDWSRPGLLRFAAFRRSDESFEFAISFHHAILDGWSLASLLAELFALYFEARGEEAPALAPSPQVTYHDFVALERLAVRSEESRHFWDETLAESVPSVLPRREGAAAGATQRRQVREFRFAPDEVEAWQTFARRAGVPLKSVLLAAHLRVLGTLTGGARGTTGLVSNGRPEALDAERVLGMFLNTVPVPFALGGGTWIELARAAAEAEQRLVPHRRFTLAEMQRARGGQSLFEVAFNYTNFHVLGKLGDFKHLEVLGGTAFARTNFALTVTFNIEQAPEGTRSTLTMDYDAAAVDEGLIESAAGYYARVLEAMTREPDGRYETFSPLSDEERRRLLSEWNPPRRDYSAGEPLHKLFERRAALTPGATAVVYEGERLTYGELNRRANQLARSLGRAGAGPESLVALCLGRSAEMVVAILAVLKSGAGYLPLEPDTPPERLTFMLSDAGARLLVTEEAHAPKFAGRPGGSDTKLVVLEAEREAIEREGVEDFDAGASADNLAYVIYTSGSTGRPKGVAVTHRNVVRLFEATRGWFDFGASDVWTLFHSYAFDFSVWELWGALLHGGRLVVVPYLVSRSPEELRGLLGREGVTVLNQTPSAFRQLMRADEAHGSGDDLRLRYVVFGGEALEPQSLKSWMESRGDERPALINMYGITETTVHVTYRPLTRADLHAAAPRSPVGGPIPDLRLYALDPWMGLTPTGVPGELYVGGAGLARGYLNRPALTAERFVPDPFSKEPGARLYRTGDVARRTAGGELEFLGRADSQVKIRGFRIELGEIEAALSEHAAVRDCVVAAREETGGQQRLVAYFCADAPPPDDAELRAHLKTRLPGYMIPSAFVPLEKFPLTPNGKVDRRALLSVEVRGEEAGASEPARTPLEELVAGVWASLLGRVEVGREDEFFALGGDSLLATRAAARLREVCGDGVSVRAIFEHPTVAALAAHLEAARRQSDAGADESIAPIAREGALPLSFSQQRQWFLHQLEPESYAYNMPAAIRLRGPLDAAALLRALSELVARHEPLRTTFEDVGGSPVQVIASRGGFAAPLVDLTELREHAREAHARALVAEESRRPFDLRRGPLLRALLVRLGAEEHVLLLLVHHIAADAWSLGVLIREVVALYGAFAQGLPSPLPELPIQYADYAVWQRRLLGGDALRSQLDYWGRRLGGALPVLRLPYERAPAAGQTFKGGSVEFRLTPEQTRELKAFGGREGATLFMTLLAAFDVLLHHYTEQEDIVVGAPVAGRTRRETEPLIGCFVNMLALRTDLSGDPTFRELIARVREVCLGAYAHQDVPFDRIVEAIKADRDPTRSPVFQTAFTLDNTPRQAAEVAGLELSYLGDDPGSTRFNLVLALADTPRGLSGVFQYNSYLLGAATVGAMAKNFELLLGRLSARPETTLSEARELLGEAERRRRTLRQQAFGEARRRMLQDAQQRLGAGPAN